MGEISGAERNKGLFPPHFHVLVFCFLPFSFSCLFLLLVSAYSSFMSCGSFCIIASVFILPSLFLCFLFTLSFLSSWLCVICPFVLTSPPSSSSSYHLFLFLSSVYFSGEYTAGRMFLLFSHSACLLIVRCRQNRLLLVTGLLSRSFQGHSCIPVTSQCGVFLSSQT